ncbi:hypothetical protein ATO10_08943 [Actibacterium atlanticum]|uniref:Lipoprotein n=1 Tax=Actibacterium atlanticum TaxID=1461693 RepID=A0A058ZL64_9RHOB|nr:hypothetical protein [Actibacterium atlanticum]KCV81960.1 hypothetical protein ATO10_08943 [Actibacterium atlanticum]
MKPIKAIAFGMSALLLAGCIDAPKRDKTRDYGIDRKDLSQLRAGIWVDPQGCDHWIIDDGAEGYLSARLDKYGKPVCSGIAPPETAVGPYKSGSAIEDPI